MMASLPKVLIVEDDERLAKAVSCWLTELAFDAEYRLSAEDGLVALDEGHFDVVLVDLGLPAMNGHAMLRQIRRAGMNLPVIVMSGTGEVEDLIKLLRHSVADYLAKPFRIEDLEAALERALAQRKVALGSAKDNAKIPRQAAAKSASTDGGVRSSIAELQKSLEDGVLDLPVVDPKLAELRGFLGRDDYSLDDVVDVISHDTSLAGVIMRTANSAFYSRGRQIESLRDACVWIGPKLVIGIALEVTLRSNGKQHGEPFQEILESMTKNSVIAARMAVVLCRKLRRSDDSEVFVLTLLHNLGEILCVQLFAELHAAEEADFSLVELESEVKRVHEAFGFALAKSWGLPPIFVRFAGDHHGEPKGSSTEEQARQIVLAAWSLALQAGFTYFPGHAEVVADEHLSRLGLAPELTAELLAQIESWGDA